MACPRVRIKPCALCGVQSAVARRHGTAELVSEPTTRPMQKSSTSRSPRRVNFSKASSAVVPLRVQRVLDEAGSPYLILERVGEGTERDSRIDTGQLARVGGQEHATAQVSNRYSHCSSGMTGE